MLQLKEMLSFLREKFFNKKKIAVVVAVVVFVVIIFPFVYIKYQAETSCDLTYFAYRSVENELNECVDFFTSVCKDTIGENYSDYHIRIRRTDENRYTLYLWCPETENKMEEIKTITDETGKVWNNVKKIKDAFNSNGFELFFPPALVGFDEFEIVNNEFNFRCLLNGEAGLKGVTFALDGHKPEHYCNRGFMYYRLSKNWYGLRENPFYKYSETVSQVQVIIPE